MPHSLSLFQLYTCYRHHNRANISHSSRSLGGLLST
jgi:hypothetical protein